MLDLDVAVDFFDWVFARFSFIEFFGECLSRSADAEQLLERYLLNALFLLL